MSRLIIQIGNHWQWCINHQSSSIIAIIKIIARSALYVRAHSQNWNVSPSVRKVITFCEEDMRAARVPLDLGVLNYESDDFFKFWKILKKSARSVHINGICSREKSRFGSILMNFFETFEKGVCDVDCVTGEKLMNWRIWDVMLGVDFLDCLWKTSASRPCRARCI